MDGGGRTRREHAIESNAGAIAECVPYVIPGNDFKIVRTVPRKNRTNKFKTVRAAYPTLFINIPLCSD
jgi:hypothetical protein